MGALCGNSQYADYARLPHRHDRCKQHDRDRRYAGWGLSPGRLTGKHGTDVVYVHRRHWTRWQSLYRPEFRRGDADSNDPCHRNTGDRNTTSNDTSGNGRPSAGNTHICDGQPPLCRVWCVHKLYVAGKRHGPGTADDAGGSLRCSHQSSTAIMTNMKS